jgi:hypothetical protein
MAQALKGRVDTLPVENGCAATTPTDPTTNAEYGYRRIDGDSFELCAIFERGWPETAASPEGRRRPLRRYPTYAKQRYVELPPTGGEACFALEAARFEVEDSTTERETP